MRTMVQISAQSDIFFTRVIAQKTLKLGPIGTRTQKNEGYLPDKVKNGKYPEVNLSGFINYGRMWMV